MTKTFTICQIAIDLPFQNEQLTVHDLPLSNDGQLHGDCIANGIFPAGSASIPYVITFVL